MKLPYRSLSCVATAVASAAFLAGCRSSSNAVATGFDGKPLATIDLSVETKSRRRNFDHAEFLGPVSLLQVVANPERIDGKRIVVRGFAMLGFEAQGIFPLPGLSISPKNGVWLDYDFGRLPNNPDPAVLRPMLIEGVFDAKGGGHFGMWAGELCDISRIQYLDGRNMPAVSSSASQSGSANGQGGGP